MIKEFFRWIRVKEFIHDKAQPPTFDERDVWWVNVGQNVGHEENGKGHSFTRPFVVIKKFNRNLLFGVPCSSVLKENKYYFPISIEVDNFYSAALLSQARIISSKRLVRFIGSLGGMQFNGLKKALQEVLFY